MNGIIPLSALASAMQRDLRENVLPFWMHQVRDERHGGFLGYISDDLTVDPAGPKGGVLNARILWTFAAAFRRYGDPACRKTADRALAYLLSHFWDETHGGIYWMLDHEGRPLADRKQTCNLAFAFFLEAAEATWRFVDRFLIDRTHGEWRWRVARDGSPIPGLPKVEPWKCPYHNSRAALEIAERADRPANQPG